MKQLDNSFPDLHDARHERFISLNNLNIQSLVWLALPMFIFLYGWMRWWISVPLCLLLLFSGLRIIMRLRADGGHGAKTVIMNMGRDKWSDVKVSGTLVTTILIIGIVLVFFGMGGFVAQHPDYFCRNAVFFDLAKKDWPVTYDGSEPRLLCYYFAFWLPSAVASKVTGYIMAGDLMQLLWGLWGMSIGYCWLVSYLGGNAKWYVFPIVLLFGFWDAPLYGEFYGYLSEIFGVGRDEFYSNYMTFSLIPQIRMIFNQTISLWVALPVLYRSRENPVALLLISSLLFLYSPLPCVGISLAVLYWLIRGGKRSLTIENLTGLLLMAVSGLFYMSNNSADGVGANHRAPWYIVILLGVMFFIVAIGVLLPIVWNRIGRNRTFYILVAIVFFLPLLALGKNEDLCRRAMIPMTIMLTYAVMWEIGNWKSLSKWKHMVLPIVVAIGMYDACDAIDETVERIEQFREEGRGPKLGYVMGKLDQPDAYPYYDNFIAEGDSFYTRYLMKK